MSAPFIKKIEKLDHLGVIMGTMNRLKLPDLLESIFPKDSREEISTGQAIMGMVLNGLGFTNSPLSMTPQFFETRAVSSFFGNDVKASHFNHFKLGRALDDIHSHGCEKLFSAICAQVVQSEGISTTFNCLDTSSISVTGEYETKKEEGKVTITHGYSKDHRPDLKQFIIELMVSQDGGVPLLIKSHNGNASDSKIFRERGKALLEAFKKSDILKILVGDSKLYAKETAEQVLAHIHYITRIPGTIEEEQETINKAVESKAWQSLETKEGMLKFQTFDINHYGIVQRWIVCSSSSSEFRAQSAVDKAVKKEKEKIESQLKKINSNKYKCREDLIKSLNLVFFKSLYHKLDSTDIEEINNYHGRGRPKSGETATDVIYKISVKFSPDNSQIKRNIAQRSCFVIGTNVPKEQLSDQAVILGYKGQQAVEQGFGFLKGNCFFADSIYLKNPRRIEALIMIMVLALLIYSIAQRYLRNTLKDLEKTIPNQLKKPTQTPTLRWIFALLEGIYSIVMQSSQGEISLVQGISDKQRSIIQYFGPEVSIIYGIATVT